MTTTAVRIKFAAEGVMHDGYCSGSELEPFSLPKEVVVVYEGIETGFDEEWAVEFLEYTYGNGCLGYCESYTDYSIKSIDIMTSDSIANYRVAQYTQKYPGIICVYDDPFDRLMNESFSSHNIEYCPYSFPEEEDSKCFYCGRCCSC